MLHLCIIYWFIYHNTHMEDMLITSCESQAASYEKYVDVAP